MTTSTPTAHTAEPLWASGGPGKSAYTDYRWECGCGTRYDGPGEIGAQHAAHLAAALLGVPVAAATVGRHTVTLIEGTAGYLTQITAYDGAVYGDAMAVRMEDETPEQYVARHAAALHASW